MSEDSRHEPKRWKSQESGESGRDLKTSDLPPFPLANYVLSGTPHLNLSTTSAAPPRIPPRMAAPQTNPNTAPVNEPLQAPAATIPINRIPEIAEENPN